MPHRGQETVIRVLRLWRWRDIPRRTRPTRVYHYRARHVSRTYRLSAVCTPRYDVCATKVIVRGAHAGPRTLGHLPSGCGIDPGFLGLHGHRLQGAQAPQRARAGSAAMPFATKSARSRNRRTAQTHITGKTNAFIFDPNCADYRSLAARTWVALYVKLQRVLDRAIRN